MKPRATKNRITACLLAAALFAPTSLPADEVGVLLNTIKDFYTWSLANAKSLKPLEPKILEIKGSDRLTLEISRSDAYAERFLASGLFAKEFPRNVKRYYEAVYTRLKAMDDGEFAQLKRDGDAPLMETEDMDPLFCAQEYRYDTTFIEAMRLVDASITGDRARAVVVSPYEWETAFAFKRENRRWLIAGFCVFLPQN